SRSLSDDRRCSCRRVRFERGDNLRFDRLISLATPAIHTSPPRPANRDSGPAVPAPWKEHSVQEPVLIDVAARWRSAERDDLWLRWTAPGPAATGPHRGRALTPRRQDSPASQFSAEHQRDQPHLAQWGAFDHVRRVRDPHVYPFSTYKRSIRLTFHDVWWWEETVKTISVTVLPRKRVCVENLTHAGDYVQFS